MSTARRLRAQAAAHTRWAHTADREAATAPARKSFLDRFEREVDPDGVLDPAERARRAESAKKAYFLRLAAKSAETRQAKAVKDAYLVRARRTARMDAATRKSERAKAVDAA